MDWTVDYWTSLPAVEIPTMVLPQEGYGSDRLPNTALRELRDQVRISVLTGLHLANMRILLFMAEGLTVEKRNLLLDSLWEDDLGNRTDGQVV